MMALATLKHQVTAWAVWFYAMITGLLNLADEVVQLLAATAAFILVVIQIMIKIKEYRAIGAKEKT